LSEEQVLGFVQGELTRSILATIDQHLNGCPSCSALVLEAVKLGAAESYAAPRPPRNGCWTFEPGGCVAGRYLIRRALGSGGMGEVYEVFDQHRQEALALKTARASKGDEPEALQRLSSEAALARRVRHPNVCRVYDVGVHHDSRPHGGELGFLSMELIAGQPLAERAQLEAFTAPEVRHLARQLFLGVAAIHRAGVIHRDIKSHNVMLRPTQAEPNVVIIDFGLAIDVTGELAVPPLPERSFSIEGSPAYMAPEQFRNVPSTPATDVFACGVVLFEALTRSLPFRSLHPERRHNLRDPSEVPLRAAMLSTRVPACLDAFLARCLELDPARRFATAELALAELLSLRWG
jgi:serine/threonine protein kinase